MSRRPRRANVSVDELDRLVEGDPLPAATGRYFARVLRLAAGTIVEVGDGSGRIATGRLERAGERWILEAAELSERVADVQPLVLCAGLLKAKRWSLLVEKCVELGVQRLVPLLAARTQAPPGGDLPRLTERWNRVALEAAKQCRRAVATVVAEPVDLASALASEAAENRLMADAHGTVEWPAEALAMGAETVLLVGPEGGFTEEERAAATVAGFLPISLGAFTLRAETAALALVVLARDRLGFAQREVERPPCP